MTERLDKEEHNEEIEYYESLADFASAKPDTREAHRIVDYIYIYAKNNNSDFLKVDVENLSILTDNDGSYYVEGFLPCDVRVRGTLESNGIKFPVHTEHNCRVIDYKNIVFFARGKNKSKEELMKIVKDFCEEIDIEKTIEQHIEFFRLLNDDEED